MFTSYPGSLSATWGSSLKRASAQRTIERQHRQQRTIERQHSTENEDDDEDEDEAKGKDKDKDSHSHSHSHNNDNNNDNNKAHQEVLSGDNPDELPDIPREHYREGVVGCLQTQPRNTGTENCQLSELPIEMVCQCQQATGNCKPIGKATAAWGICQSNVTPLRCVSGVIGPSSCHL